METAKGKRRSPGLLKLSGNSVKDLAKRELVTISCQFRLYIRRNGATKTRKKYTKEREEAEAEMREEEKRSRRDRLAVKISELARWKEA